MRAYLHRFGRMLGLVVPTVAKPRRREFWLLAGVIGLGLALRTAQYLADTSLWLDEVALVKAILELNLRELATQSLPYDQVAPKGFLLAQRTAVLAFGPGDYVLRFVPYLSAVLALFVYASFVRRALPSFAAFVATLLFAITAPFIVFSGTVKQYSTDVCVAIVLSWIALDLIIRPVTQRRAWLAAGSGALLQWFSQPSVLVTAGLILPVMLWMSSAPSDARLRRVCVVVGMWAASAATVTLWSLATTSAETRDYMRLYWADGLAPVAVGDWMRSGWPWPSIHRLFRGGFGAQAGFGYPLSPLYAILTTVGFVVLWRHNRPVALILLAPVAVTLAAAVARQYPFRDRLILFLAPGAIAAIGEATWAATAAATRYSPRVAVLVAVAIIVPAALPVATKLPPYHVEHVKRVIGYVQARRQPGDDFYVYYAAAPVMSMYDSAFGFPPGAYAVGGCHRGDSRRYLEELDTFRGRPRVWVILTHSLPVYREREDILAYLDTIGTRKDYVSVLSRAVSGEPFPAEGFLYDLSRTAQLAAADSASFTVTNPIAANERNTCVNGPHAMIPSDFVCTGPPGTRCTRRPRILAGSAAAERWRD
jgi:hypothetical protein